MLWAHVSSGRRREAARCNEVRQRRCLRLGGAALRKAQETIVKRECALVKTLHPPVTLVATPHGPAPGPQAEAMKTRKNIEAERIAKLPNSAEQIQERQLGAPRYA